PATNLHHLSLDDPGYRPYIAPELFRQMSNGQAGYLQELLADLRSETLSSRRDELYYGFRIRQALVSSSKLKNADLEVYNPLLGRRVMEWSRSIPDGLRNYKLLFKHVIKHSFPELADIPFATARFQGDWANRIRRDRGLIRFYRSWFDGSGWAERAGARPQLVRRLEELDAGADTAAIIPPRRSYQDTSGLKFKLRNTWIGQFARELGFERKVANQTPEHLRIGRLAVIHGLFGQIERRRSAAAPALSTR
ncbi:MAG TPA: hypothetical protein VEA40_02770, partial [Ramlibacter sp.]|nr:hypothetical protein [Ramlibacter sp.]